MVRVLGTVMIWGGCVLWGVRAATELRRRVALLEDIGRALEEMERELVLNRRALPELLERVSCRGTKQGNELFAFCRKTIEKGKAFTCAWEESLKRSGLQKEEQMLLCGLAQMLGQYDVQAQSDGLLHLREELERRAVRCREEARTLGKVYGTLGVTAGGFLSLMLL